MSPTVSQGLELLRSMQARGLRHGAVEDKLYLPGLQKLARLVGAGDLGRITGFRLEFGWWVFDGTDRPGQRPSWNYRRAGGGGGLILDMYPHWRYIIETILGRILAVSSASWTAMPERIDEQGQRYEVDVEDAAATLIELDNGAFGTILSSWATRVRRDDLFTLQVDGTKASALAGLHRCHVPDAARYARRCAFQRDEGPRRRLSRRLERGAAACHLQEPVPRRLGDVPAARCDGLADAGEFRRRHPRRAVRRSLPSQHG